MGHELVRATKKIAVRMTGINPYYMTSVKFGLAAATLQHVSNGRFGMVLAAGGQHMLQTFGLDWVSPVTKIRETITMIKQLITGDLVKFNGKTVTAKGNQLWFEAPKKIPFYIGTQGPKLLQLAGEIASGVVIDGGTPAFAEWALARINEGASRSGRDIEKEIEEHKFWLHTTLPVSISEDRDDACERIRRFIPYVFYTMSEERRKRAGVPESLVTEVQRLLQDQSPNSFDQAKELCSNAIIQKIAPVGTPEDAIRYLKNSQQSGWNGFDLYPGTKKEQKTEETLKFLAEDVRPQFK